MTTTPEPQPLPEPTIITRGAGESIVWGGFETPTPTPTSQED